MPFQSNTDENSLRHAIDSHQFDFNLIRFLLSSLVIFGHSFDLFRSGEIIKEDPTWAVSNFTYSGHTAVLLFFFLSGMLVSSSISKHSHVNYVLYRIFRVYPGLIANIVISISVGALLTTAEFHEYKNSAYEYAFNLSLLSEKMSYTLAGVFESHKLALFNIPIWTLPFEINCYLTLLAISLLLRPKGWGSYLALMAIAAVGIYNYKNFAFHFSVKDFELPVFFFIGCGVFLLSRHIALSARKVANLFLISLAIFIITAIDQAAFFIVRYISFYSLLIEVFAYIALKVRFEFFKKNDISYGIYIYGFMIQQLVYSIAPELTSALSCIPALLLTIGVALLSWHFIERPCQNFIRKFTRRHEARLGKIPV